jgi:hypothetical protein
VQEFYRRRVRSALGPNRNGLADGSFKSERIMNHRQPYYFQKDRTPLAQAAEFLNSSRFDIQPANQIRAVPNKMMERLFAQMDEPREFVAAQDKAVMP